MSLTLPPKAIKAAKTCAALRGLSVSSLVERMIWREVESLAAESRKAKEPTGTGEET